MASNFTLIPTWVDVLEPEFNTVITESDGGTKQYQALSDVPLYRFKLRFENLSGTSFWILYNHYVECKGQYDSFSWQSVPSYIDTDQDGTPDGTNMTGRWVEKSFKPRTNAKTWDAEIIFEKQVT